MLSKKAVRRLSAAVKNLLWPPGRTCLICGAETDRRSLCSVCQLELEEERLSPEEALTHGADPEEADRFLSVFRYLSEGKARALVHALKFHALEEAGEQLAVQMAIALHDSRLSPSLITWVPMPRKRMRMRGIDHARVLAERLADTVSLPCLPLLSRRLKDEPPQHELSRAERLRRAPLSFLLLPADAARGQHVLLVDDVLTTGATAQACAHLLKQAGAAEVTVLTAARREKWESEA